MPTSPLVPQRSYVAGCGLVVLSGLILSLGVLCIRGAGGSDAIQYLFWRAIAFTVAVSIIAVQRRTLNPITQVRGMRGFAWLAAGAMVFSQIGFIAAVKMSTVAEVFFLLSLAPLMAAVIAFPVLGERLGVLGALAICIALAGVALMTGGGWQGGSWEGRFLALGAALAFALYSLAIRGARAEDLDAALVATGVLTAIACLIILLVRGLPLVIPIKDLGLALLHGGIILSAGLVLMAWGSRTVTAVTLIMLAQSESIAAPVWTYLFFDETTTLAVIVGGALILLAVALQAADGARQSAPPKHNRG
jgi:drug/metabolite transporter, DME family